MVVEQKGLEKLIESILENDSDKFPEEVFVACTTRKMYGVRFDPRDHTSGLATFPTVEAATNNLFQFEVPNNDLIYAVKVTFEEAVQIANLIRNRGSSHVECIFLLDHDYQPIATHWLSV